MLLFPVPSETEPELELAGMVALVGVTSTIIGSVARAT